MEGSIKNMQDKKEQAFVPELSLDNIPYWRDALNSSNKIKNINDQKVQVSSPDPQLFSPSTKLSRRKSLRNTFKQRIKEKALKRISQNKITFVITIFSALLMGSQNLYLFLWQEPAKDAYFFFPTLILRPIFFILESYRLCRNYKVMAKIFFSFDRVLMTLIATAISIVIFCETYIPFAQYQWVFHSLEVVGPILLITFAGYCRMILVFCQWNKWQTIVFKICIAFGGASYFGLGMYYTIIDVQFTNGVSIEVDQTIKNLLFLYAFAGFDYHIQIFSMFDEIDGTNKFRLTYQLEVSSDDIQCLLYGKNLKKHQNQGNLSATKRGNQAFMQSQSPIS